MKLLALVLAIVFSAMPLAAQVSTGIDVLEQEHFAPLKRLAAKHGGRLRLGVLTDQVGIDSHGRRTIDVLRRDAAAEVPGLVVTRIFSPESGIHGDLSQSHIPDGGDAESGLPIFSVYGLTPAQQHPSAAQLAGLDAVVIDLQDAGVRFWTYQTLMAYFLEASAPNHLYIVVLDRPDPINGLAVQGPLVQPGREDYVGYFDEPIRPGMTMGELAELFNAANRLKAHLTVIKMQGWRREDWYDQTGLLWVNPSPHLRSLLQATVYPGIGLLEGTNVAVKGGIDTPFVRFGAPWISAVRLAQYLNARKIPGASFLPVFFTPASRGPLPHYRWQYPGERCNGVEVIVTDRNKLNSPELGIEAASALFKLYPKTFELGKVDRLLKNSKVLDEIRSGEDPRKIAAGWQPALAAFRAERAKYLLYK